MKVLNSYIIYMNIYFRIQKQNKGEKNETV